MARESGRVDPIEELSERVEGAAAWVVRHRWVAAALAGAILVGAAGYGFYASSNQRRELAASAALARLEAGYREAMGTPPDSLEVVEPANPELAQRARREYAASFAALATERAGTVAAVLARLAEGSRHAELGDQTAALAAFEAAREAAPAGSALRGLVLLRLGTALEQAGRPADAARALEEAGGLSEFPLRWQALAEAARNRANAGDEAGAAELFARIEAEAPDAELPDHLRARLREIAARRSADAAPPEPGG